MIGCQNSAKLQKIEEIQTFQMNILMIKEIMQVVRIFVMMRSKKMIFNQVDKFHNSVFKVQMMKDQKIRTRVNLHLELNSHLEIKSCRKGRKTYNNI